MARTTIDELLAHARGHLTRLDRTATLAAMRSGAALIDIRGDSQIAQDGVIPGAVVIPATCSNGGLTQPADTATHMHRASTTK